ncbi:2-dehydropantoate 2-reductase [Vibrio gallicus]|uniref:2-dehydropantoate 2-reductase n=1 Tax=Vibrio gallicus TaxID=190897 RepID=UPI0021C29B4B|nr:2-dehydropantoate 2-reductase [Vibrio gallicus]
MKIAVVGMGAIGSLFAYSLSQDGHQLSCWTKGQHSTLSIALDKDNIRSFPTNIPSQLEQCELVIVCVKSWQLQQALKQVLPYIPLAVPILISHNGMGAIEQSNKLLINRPILFATTTHAALKPSSNQVLHTGWGQTTIGPYSEQARNLTWVVDLINHALPVAKWEKNIKQALWHKLAINCCINPLTALLNCRNGALDTPDTANTIKAICSEVSLVMQADGFQVHASQLDQTVNSVIKATANNYSSMHQDIAHHRKTEIDYITGYLLQRAKIHTIDTPHNLKLYQEIKQLEVGNDN